MNSNIFSKLNFLAALFQYVFLISLTECQHLAIEPNSTFLDGNILTLSISDVVSTEQSNTVLVRVHLERSIGAGERIFKKEFYPIDNGIVKVIAKIPDKIVYFDSRDPDYGTEYFARNLRIHACIFEAGICIVNDHVRITLPDPWRRKEIPTYSPAWNLKVKMLNSYVKIPVCKKIADVIDLTTSQLAVSGKHDQGFMKSIQPIKWPRHVPKTIRDVVLSNNRFTLSLWTYILEKCPNDYCEILSHRKSLSFLTPVILLTKNDHIHIQLHDKKGGGEAFITSVPIPLRRWLHLVFTLTGNEVLFSVGSMKEKGVYQRYLHRSKEIAFNSETGLWNMGGYFGFTGIRGIICCVKLYRRKSLQPEELTSVPKDRKTIQRFDVPRLVSRCSIVRKKYHSLWEKYIHEPSSSRSTNLKHIFLKKKENLARCKAKRRLSEDLKEVINTLENVFKDKILKDLHNKKSVAKQLNILGLNLISSSSRNATRFLEISGCLGYMESFMAFSLAKNFANDKKIDSNEVITKQLYAAMHGEELSQLALSTKHQIGLDGLVQDTNIAAGYAKGAAVTVKKIMENEEQYIHTHSEMIRLDEAHLFAGKRGLSSDVMKWLKNQAYWGSMSAQSQMAEILFHGQHGVEAQRNEAINLYRAGALQGDANSMYNLGVLHLRGIEVEKNETKAVDLFRKAAEKNFTIAYNSLGYHELVNRNNISGALHFWELASNMGDKDAMTNFGIQHENGVAGILEANKSKAFELFKKSASLGQKDGCIKYADYLITGEVGEKDGFTAIRFYRYVAEQLPTIGLYLRNAVDSYLEGQLNTSLIMYMLISETGLALASYNTAFLCDEMLQYGMNVGPMGSNCSLHFYNMSATLGWPASIIKIGDEYWYGKRLPVNRTKAISHYAWIAKHQESPQAFFNLGFAIENNYSFDGINLDGLIDSRSVEGNLTLAKSYYERCQRSKEDSESGYYPCTIALLKLRLKSIIQESKFALVSIGLAFGIFILVGIFSSDEI